MTVAKFGDPIYPCLKQQASVCNAPESDLWHTLIEADNYHALQLLEYLYAGKVDCIYIDPPYNTGAGEWKYNDKYVDSSDCWAHSKWLAMIKKRLLKTKKLLNDTGVIIISIGYQELHHLVILCKELFPAMQVVSVTVQVSSGKPAHGFNYQQEYLVFVTPPNFSPNPMSFAGGKENKPYHAMTLATFTQTQRPNQVYPIFIEKSTGQIIGCGDSIQERVHKGKYSGKIEDFVYDYTEAPEGSVAVWPISKKGDQCVWRLIPSRIRKDIALGYIKVSPQKKGACPNEFSIQYLSDGIIQKIHDGEIAIQGRESVNNTIILGDVLSKGADIPTIWTDNVFYTQKGTSQIQAIFGGKEFPYPKPLNLILEIVRACTNNDSLIVDFFAGSGTTLHAVNLLNAEDGGHRRCIMVTNNEVSVDEAKSLTEQGYHPGDAEWEKLGIARYVNWPRTVCSIEGHDVNGNPLKGTYIGSDRPMAEGFKANAVFFKLSFLDKNAVALGRQFKELLPMLWMKAGAYGVCPKLTGALPKMLSLPENRFAVLLTENAFPELEAELTAHPEIETVYIVTDYEASYRAMAKGLKVKAAYQLYRDYLDNFRINTERN